MKNIGKLLNNSYDNLLEQKDYPQNMRCKINTGFLCNHGCNFCYFYSKRNVCNTTFDNIKKQLEVAKMLGVRHVDFSGGEPTLHDQFVQSLHLARRSGSEDICCITNGTKLCNEDFFKECIENGLNDVLLSIHGTVNVHESVTKTKNSFDKAIKTIENCEKYGIKIRINTVVTNHNYNNLTSLAYLLSVFKILQWNMIIYKMQYECGDPTKDNFISHKEISPMIKTSLDMTPTIPIKNVRYIPFCFMDGYEQYVTNYHQKIYDPYEWSNYLLKQFEQPEIDFMRWQPCSDIDIKSENLRNIREIRQYQYKKTLKCLQCKFFLICDGFEYKYSDRVNIEEEAQPINGKHIKDPLYYRNGEKC